MAKSARASQIKTNRFNIRKKVFNKPDLARAERLSAKLMEVAAQPKPERPQAMDVDVAKSSKKKSAEIENEPTPEDSMVIDEPETSKHRSSKPRSGRVQKKRRGKSHATIAFPVYKNGRKLRTGGKARR